MIHGVFNEAPLSLNKIAAGLRLMHPYQCSLQNPDRMPLGAFYNHIDSVKVLFLENHKLKQVYETLNISFRGRYILAKCFDLNLI